MNIDLFYIPIPGVRKPTFKFFNMLDKSMTFEKPSNLYMHILYLDIFAEIL